MLKKSLFSPAQPWRVEMRHFPCSVLVSLPATVNREALNVIRGSAAKLRPCLGQGASLGEEAVSADSGQAGEVVARVWRVRRLAFLSILPECYPVVPHMRTTEVFVCQRSSSATY